MTASMAGGPRETSVPTLPCRRVTLLPEPWATKISMTTAYGAKSRPTVRSGCRVRYRRIGLLINMDTGSRLSRGAGPGSTTLPGDMPPSTTGAGFTPADIGDGPQVPLMYSRCTLLLWLPGLAARDGELTSASVWAVDLAGAHWVLENRSTPGTAAGLITSAA